MQARCAKRGRTPRQSEKKQEARRKAITIETRKDKEHVSMETKNASYLQIYRLRMFAQGENVCRHSVQKKREHTVGQDKQEASGSKSFRDMVLRCGEGSVLEAGRV